jgi:hypothetical protein
MPDGYLVSASGHTDNPKVSIGLSHRVIRMIEGYEVPLHEWMCITSNLVQPRYLDDLRHRISPDNKCHIEKRAMARHKVRVVQYGVVIAHFKRGANPDGLDMGAERTLSVGDRCGLRRIRIRRSVSPLNTDHRVLDAACARMDDEWLNCSGFAADLRITRDRDNFGRWDSSPKDNTPDEGGSSLPGRTGEWHGSGSCHEYGDREKNGIETTNPTRTPSARHKTPVHQKVKIA